MSCNLLLALVVAIKYSYSTLTAIESAVAVLLLGGVTAFVGFPWLRWVLFHSPGVANQPDPY